MAAGKACKYEKWVLGTYDLRNRGYLAFEKMDSQADDLMVCFLPQD
jgi:hypothetical protein